MAENVYFLSKSEECIEYQLSKITINSIRASYMKLKHAVDSSDLSQFTQKSDLKGLKVLCVNWLLIVVAFLIPALSFNAFSLSISVLLLANRQLGLAILMHECAHYGLFKNRKWNQILGQLLCAAPVLADLNGYRRYHMKHHKLAGTTDDPDYPNYKNYPVSGKSLLRKTLRDFSGMTALKTLYAVMLMNAGLLHYDMSYQSHKADRRLTSTTIAKNLLINLSLPFFVHLLMWAILYSLGHGYLYLLWWLSYLTVYMFFLRIRNAAEHGAVPDLLDSDPRLHARTTLAHWWDRLTFAPNFVNFHLEHHWQPNVPCYHLKNFHQFLKNQGLLDGVLITKGYKTVVLNHLKSHTITE